jgi:hypothetical protein
LRISVGKLNAGFRFYLFYEVKFMIFRNFFYYVLQYVTKTGRKVFRMSTDSGKYAKVTYKNGTIVEIISHRV